MLVLAIVQSCFTTVLKFFAGVLFSQFSQNATMKLSNRKSTLAKIFDRFYLRTARATKVFIYIEMFRKLLSVRPDISIN